MSDPRGWSGVWEDINEQAQDAMRGGFLVFLAIAAVLVLVCSPVLVRVYLDVRETKPCERCGFGGKK